MDYDKATLSEKEKAVITAAYEQPGGPIYQIADRAEELFDGDLTIDETANIIEGSDIASRAHNDDVDYSSLEEILIEPPISKLDDDRRKKEIKLDKSGESRLLSFVSDLF